LNVTDTLTIKELFGVSGILPITRNRFRIIAIIRLALVLLLAILPTQIFMRQCLKTGWNPDFGGHVVMVHLVTMIVYLLVGILLMWQARPSSECGFGWLHVLNRIGIGCEIVTNQVFLVAFGSLDNYSIGFLILTVIAYRVLFDYRTALGTLLVALVLFLGFAGLEINGTLPPAALYSFVPDHPIRNNPNIWINILIFVPMIMILAFMATNYSVNQSVKLHIYVTRSVLQRYLHPSLVDRAAAGELQMDAPPERRVVTVMFTDIVGFTSLSERMAPEALGALLNTLLGDLATLAMAHGATVDKFVGDCIMVVFGAPEPCPPAEQVERCVELGRALHAKVADAGKDHQLQARSGLNTGEAIVGNFGSAARSDYTVLGPPVNIAARLESASRNNRILLGPESARLLDRSVQLEPAGHLVLKGISEPIEAWFLADE